MFSSQFDQLTTIKYENIAAIEMHIKTYFLFARKINRHVLLHDAEQQKYSNLAMNCMLMIEEYIYNTHFKNKIIISCWFFRVVFIFLTFFNDSFGSFGIINEISAIILRFTNKISPFNLDWYSIWCIREHIKYQCCAVAYTYTWKQIDIHVCKHSHINAHVKRYTTNFPLIILV